MAYGRSYALNRGSYGARRGSFLSGLVRTVGNVGRAVIGTVARTVIPGAGIASAVLSRPVMPGGMPTLSSAAQRPEPGITGAVHRLVPGGKSGYIRGKRMNAGNAKAARRAIRRIKAVRHLLQSIERELPRRPAARTGGSRGVITRAEAARALRA